MRKIVGIIPARYASTRFPGKPLVDIHGKPMVWWVYQQAKLVDAFDDVFVATDSEKIMDACKKCDIDALFTSSDHSTHINRLHEVSQKVKADLYACICGDEPLVKAETIAKVLPNEYDGGFVVRSLIRHFDDPAEALDPSNIKVIANKNDECLLLTRSLAPFPYKSLSFKFKKLVGIECYSSTALEFFSSSPVGFLEKIEDIALLRFVENSKPIKFIMSEAHQLGVDTPKDLDRVRQIMQEAIDKGELVVE